MTDPRPRRAFNFSAGPAALPEAVLRRAQRELLDWGGRGMGLIEMSHLSFGRRLKHAVVAKILTRCHASAVYRREFSGEFFLLCRRKCTGQIPVISRSESHTLALALNHQTSCNRLYTTCRKTAGYLTPQHW